MSYAGRVLIYGGRGALGLKCISHFKANNFEAFIASALQEGLKGEKLDGIFCVAGGWIGGNAKKNLAKNSELMWKQSVCSSLVAATLATKYLKENAIVQFTGAKAALDPTPGMLGYGVAKAAVHQLTKSLASDNSGLPQNTTVVAILPVTLDTPMNRKWMPDADHSTWTPLDFIADLFLKWTKGEGKPANGSLLQLLTKDSKTDLVPV
ncbi:dihydropteridine reductase-like isoform X2 [Rhynchophorus ferrugineus]|uniref:dihydropteridine reductase-like isoform X2 n=1 Tax=Rhynchophorus ferrugineus TaxID=354439 RepID=UPI003FCC5E8B